jgi:hypothetical protein
MKVPPRSWTTSYRVTALGWLSRAAARASRITRAWAGRRSSNGMVGGNTTSLTATSRPRTASWARQTTPIPPRPRGALSA